MGSIRIEGLSATFGSVTAVDDVSIDIRDGDFLVLLGPSGCGKSTLLRMLAGLLEPTSGRVLLDDVDITHTPAKLRDVAMVFQSYALYPHLSVAKNLAFPLRAKGIPKDDVTRRVAAVAGQLDIAHLLERKPRALSGGQRQRVAVGRAIIREPKAFLMDEPLSNLDAALRTSTRRALVELHRELGTTFVYVTHDQVEAMTMATRIALFNHGALEQVGTPEDVYDTPASVFVAGFLGSPPMNLLNATVRTDAGRVLVTGEGFEAVLWHGQTPDREVVFGIRPEQLRPVDDTAAIRIPAAVADIENLGSEQIVYCQVGSQRVLMRTPRHASTRIGETLTLGTELAHAHLFDRASGRRLDWPAESAADHTHNAMPIVAHA